jgi:hypothetical protein
MASTSCVGFLVVEPSLTIKRPALFMPGVLFARLVPWLLAAGIAGVWLTALAGPFQFDDYNVIVNNPAVHGLAAWWQAPLGIRPLLKLSYALNWSLSPTAFAFHLGNLLLHLLNVYLLWRVLLRLLPQQPHVAVVAALLWALHPAQTEAITYICGRSVSLMTTFWLLALLDFTRERMRWRIALWTALALAVRETAWIIPFSLLLLGRAQGRPAITVLRQALPAFGVVLLAAIVFLLDPHYRTLLDFSAGIRDHRTQLLSQISALHYFLVGPVLGLTPNIDPDIALQEQVDPVWLWQSGLLLLGLTMALIALCKKSSWLAAGLLWLLLALLPTNSIFPRLDLASDRHLYPALIGPAWAVALLLVRLPFRQLTMPALILLLATATLIRNEDYRSEYALWLRTAAQSPGKARVWNNLGYACREAGDGACARSAWQQALRIEPDNSKVRLNLYFLEKAR